MKMSNFGTKNALFGYFWAGALKNIVIFEVSTLEFVKNKFLNHTPNLGIGLAFSKDPGSAFSKGPGYKILSGNSQGVIAACDLILTSSET